MNLSFGYNGNIERYTEEQLRTSYDKAIAALAQGEKGEGKTILVWAAGNAGNSSPDVLAGLPARINELQGHSVAVVSVGEDGAIASDSNRCGIAGDFCIAAPGEQVLVAAVDSAEAPYRLDGGTSLATAIVSGGLAVMKQLFRDQLPNEALLDRLLATANDDGLYNDPSIYGHGLMDLGTATNPWGVLEFKEIGQQTTSGAGVPVTATALVPGSPLGDAFSRALAGQEAAAFDTLGAPFYFDAGIFTGVVPGATVAARLQDFLSEGGSPIPHTPQTWQFQFQEEGLFNQYGHMALADGASQLSVAGPEGSTLSLAHEPGRVQGLEVFWAAEETPLSFGLGYISEHDALLGSKSSGTFGEFSADTVFVGARLSRTAGPWTVAASGELGKALPNLGGSGWITDASSLSTSAFRLAARRNFDNGSRLGFSVSQPLRVDGGAISFTPPTAIKGGRVQGRTTRLALQSSGRQVDMTTTLEVPLAKGELSFRMTRSSQPSHQRDAAPQWFFFTGYGATW